MKRITFLCLILLLLISSCSKQNQNEKIKQQIFKQWLGKTLIIPEEIVSNQDLSTSLNFESERRSFVHYFNGSCAACLGHLKSINGFITTLKENQINLFLIAYSSTPKETRQVFMDAKLKYPVYIDSLNSLYFKNRFNSVYLESFFLDKKNKILFVGEIKKKNFRNKILGYLLDLK